MARDVGKFAKGMKVSEGREVEPEGKGDGPTLRPKHMVELMKTGHTVADGKHYYHEADDGEDPAYHKAVKEFQTCYEGTETDDSDDEGEQ